MIKTIILNFTEKSHDRLKGELKEIHHEFSICNMDDDKPLISASENDLVFIARVESNDQKYIKEAIEISSASNSPVLFIISNPDELFFETIADRENVWYIKEPYSKTELKHILEHLDSLLEKKEDQFRLITENVNDAIFVMDMKGNFSYFSPSIEKISGFTQEEALKKNLAEWITKESYDYCVDMITHFAMELGKGIVNGPPIFEIEIICKNSEIIWAELTVNPIVDNKMNFKHFIGVIRDINSRKRAEEATIRSKIEAEQANRTKSEFLATMSHELRTPLNAIIGYSQMLQNSDFGNMTEKQQRFANHISTSGKHLLELINDILDLSKVEAGKMDLHMETFGVNEVLKNVFNIIDPLAEKKNIDINIVINQDISIYADKIKFKQILYNLISNAIKFTPDHGHVTVDVTANNTALSISVIDDGIGISSEEQKKLFTPFYQADSSTARKYQGTGLGLSIVQKLIELHNGVIDVESEPGKGSRFTFMLPIKK